MMERRWFPAATVLIMAALILGACGGDGDDGDDAGSETPAATLNAGDRTWTQEEARALLDTMLVTPDDVPSVWTVMADTTSDNATAAAADPTGGASFERCGRLLGRVLVLQPEDVVSRYIGGETVSFFSTGTVYATTAGANDCAIEAAQRFSNCAELAKAFGSIFVDPAAVSCVPFDYPQIGDGSLAVGLTGKISAAGTIVDLTIKIVAWRQGNVSAVVGMAAAFDPLIDELTPLVDKVVERIRDAQS